MGTVIARELRQVNIEDEMRESYMDYAMSVIVSRALPDVRDGLKPAQRRILMAMYDLRLFPDRQHFKSAKVAGQTSGDYHPHGEGIVYPTMVRMAQDFNMRYPLIDGQGNFGSIDGDPPAAMRYTEVRLSPIALEMLADIEEETVDFRPNYDERLQEPVVLPGRFPNLLANGSEGIAVGMATRIPPHNLTELVEGIKAYLDNPDISVEELMEYIPGPDFPTYGIILGTRGIRQAYTTGKGSITLQARASIEPMEGGRQAIIITEIPYEVNKAMLLEEIANLVNNRRIDGITNIRDESDRNGIRVVIELRRDVNPHVVLNNLYKRTSMRTTFPIYMLALVEGVPRLLSLKGLIQHFVAHREEVIRRRTLHRLRAAEERVHIVEGLRRALKHLDEIIALLRQSQTRTEAREALCRRFGFSGKQAQAIIEMTLGSLVGLERERLEKEHRELLATIADLRDILASPERIRRIIKEELEELRRRYGDDRRTRIRREEAEDLSIEDLIEEEDMVLIITRDGYAKRLPVDTYRVQQRGGKGILALTKKEEDVVEQFFVASTHHYVLFFTNRGKVYRLRAFDIPQASRQAKGTPIVNMVALEPQESITATVPVDRLDRGGYLVMLTRQGVIKKTALEEFQNIHRSGILAMNVPEGDELKWVRWTDGRRELLIVTRQGMAIRFSEEEVRPMGRAATGVRALRLRAGDEVIGLEVVEEGKEVLVVSEGGLGKRTPLEEYRPQSRGGIGLITYKVTPKTGPLVGTAMVEEQDEVMLLTERGVLIRIPVERISQVGRNTQGVKLIQLEEGDRVVAVAKVVSSLEEPSASEGSPLESLEELLLKERQGEEQG